MDRRFWKVPLLVALIGWFCFRGPWHARGTNFFDFRVNYAASRAFWHHKNPYVPADILPFSTVGIDFKGTPSVYPPTAFVLWLPFAILSWRAATSAWLAVHVLAFGGLLRLMRLEFWQFAFVLLFAPMHSAFANAQPTLTVFLLIGFAIIAADRSRDATAAALIAAALCIKPQLAIAVVAYYALAQRWKITLYSLGTFILIAGFALLWLSPLRWIHDWRASWASATIPGGISDPSPANPNSHDLISLSVILNRLRLPQILALILTLLLVIMSLKPMLRISYANAVGLALALSLLPVYHRFYDAIFLLPVILPAIADRRYRLIVVGAIFLFPPVVLGKVGLNLFPAIATFSVAVLAVLFARSGLRAGHSGAGQ